MADADALIVKYNDFNHQISHPRSHYAENLQKLKDKLRDLDDCRETITRKVSEANGRGDEIEVNVSHWQTDADSLLDHIEQFIRESTNICSTDITRQYEFSKQAEEKIADADELINKYNNFNHQISHPRPRPPELESLSDKNYVNFESRGSIFMNIMDELKDSNVNMIGVFGPGGVGKTTLVKEVGEQMRKDGTFKQVAMAAVSKDLNVKDVQSRLAASLNFTFKAKVDDQVGRATKLWNKLTNGDKYLIILDDIWQEVKMEAIGIPCTNEKKGCKVVLTSRKEDLLKITMKADKNFRIGELSEAEAMDLFKKKVGKTIESQPEIDSLAQEVCRKCKGLPVAINAIGAALEDKPYRTWKNALVKLERHMFPQIEGIEPSVWASLYVSYDMLRSSDAQSHSRSSDAQSRSDAQSCFLLCCLFHEDAEIPIDELTRLCIARSLLAQNPFTLDEARNAVHTVVDALKSASLLTTGSHENVVRIHDVIRDVGISIARDQGEAFLIDHGAPRWPPIPMNAPSYSAISLAFKDIKRLPSGLVYPQLHTLIVENSKLSDVEFPDNFFNGMTQLSVLVITRMRMWRLPSSLAKLAKLRMLYLDQCELADIAILKHLKSNLEVLGIRCSNIEALPPEIGQLTSLRVLDLQDCYNLRVIPRGVIFNLTGLEELYFPFTFAEWKATIDEQQDASNRDNVSLEDLRRLLNDGQLTTLQIHIPDVKLLPNDDLIFANLKGFKISVGSEFDYWERESSTTRTCMLKAKGIQLRNEFFSLVDKAEVLILEGIQLTVYPFRLSNKYLTVLTIEEFEFKYLFTPTTAKELLHLEKLEVRSCEIMEGIVEFEGQNDGKEIICEVKFSKLKELELTKLPNLKSFYAKKEKMGTTMESSSACAQPLFNEKVIFPVLESLTIKGLDNIITIWDKQSIAIWQEQGYFCQLTDLEVKRCNKLMHVFPSNMHPLLKNLKKLEVKGCETMKGITEFEREIDEDGHRNEVAASPVLEVEHFEMVGVPKITEIRDKQPLLEPKKEVESLCKLMDIRIKNCGQLLYVFPSHMLPQNLQQLFIKKCDELEVIFSKELKEKEAINNDIIVFPRLKAVTLKALRKLKSFYTDTQGFFFSHKVVFPVLKHMDLWRLDKITRIWDDQPLSEPEKEAKSFSELEDITVCGCDQLGYVLPSYMPPQLKNLQELTIGKCTKVKVIISNNPKEKEATNNNDTIRFPQLKKVLFCDLPNLKSFICSETQLFFSNKDTFPVLKNIYLGIDLNFLRNGTCTKESSCSNPRPKPTRKRRRPPQPLLQEGEINSVVQLDESGGGVTHFQSVEEGDSATSSTHILPQASGSESALTLPALEEIDHLDANLQIFQIGTCPQRPKPDCYRGQPQRPKPKHNRRHPPRPLLQEGNSSTQTRGRGPSLMNASWSMGKNPIKIVLNDRGQPVMPEASSLATNLGVLARDGSLLPLHYTDWRYVPAHYKKRVWEEIKAHTDANDSLERWFMQSLGRKWQGWKCDAKKQGYTPYNNDADRIAHRPSRVTEEQWRCLVYYWNDRDVKEKSANNKGYRSKQKLLHTSGRTPHYLVEQKDKDDGKNPTRIDTFIKTHTRKGGGEINEETSAIVNKLKALQCQDGSSSHPMSKGVIFSKMLGAKNNDQAPSQSSTERDREFMKMNPKVREMKKYLEAMGYTDDTDDDSDELNVAPNENHPDASSAHREMTIGNNQASPEEINLAHRSQPEPTPFPRPNQQADSHHQCEPGSTAAADLAMWKQAEASRDARKTTRVTNKKRRTSLNGSN